MAVGFSAAVALAGAAWRLDAMPTRLGEWVWHWSPAIGLALLAAAIAAGQILARLQGGRPQGPADLILSAQQDSDPSIRARAASSLLGLVNLSGGASVGIFGPLVRLGGCLAAWLRSRDWLRLSVLRLSVLRRDVLLGAGAPIAATVIVFELTGSYAWAALSMISVVTASQISRAPTGRSLFDRQLELRGILVGDDDPPATPAARR